MIAACVKPLDLYSESGRLPLQLKSGRPIWESASGFLSLPVSPPPEQTNKDGSLRVSLAENISDNMKLIYSNRSSEWWDQILNAPSSFTSLRVCDNMFCTPVGCLIPHHEITMVTSPAQWGEGEESCRSRDTSHSSCAHHVYKVCTSADSALIQFNFS